MPDPDGGARNYWDLHARHDPLWAILSDPEKTGRRWDLPSFLETGQREVSLLMFQLRALGLEPDPAAALDFGCGIGRLTQPLADHFDLVVGTDISPEMIRLANEINRWPDRVRYAINSGDDLGMLSTGEFTFTYSNVVLQHIEPVAAVRYLRELFRVVRPNGVLVFQLPSHRRPIEEQRQTRAVMPAEAYRASIRVESPLPGAVPPGAALPLAASVTNASQTSWSAALFGPVRFGNHWATAAGKAMLIQDDGRAPLPVNLAPGETCRVTLTATAPREPGNYLLECDVVHEGITWFADRGSETWTQEVRVGGNASTEASRELQRPSHGASALRLADDGTAQDPGPLPMHGVARDAVEQVIRDGGGRLVHVEIDERCGKEWIGYRYFVRKT